MEQSGYAKFNSIINQLEQICNQSIQNKETIKGIYSRVNPKKDARITTFSKMINIFNSVQLSLAFVQKGFNLNWWKGIICEEKLPKSAILSYIRVFMSFSKIGFVQLLFSNTESSLRIFLRTLDPNACNGGMGSFKSVYTCLFKSKLSIYPSEGIELLDLFRLGRNTSHNNGVYFDPNRQDRTINWRGKSYKFKHSTPIDFVNWPFVMEISDAVWSLMYEVVTDNNLQIITHEIKDPYEFVNESLKESFKNK